MSSSGSACASRQMAQPTPGYTLPYLWPEVLIEATRSRRKSHTRSGSMKGATIPPRSSVHVDGHVEAGALLQIVEGVRDLQHRLVRAVEGRAEDGHHADGVLVAELDRLLAVKVETVSLHRHVAGLDLEVVAELLPADLDVYAHDHVGPLGALPGRASPLLPAPFEGETS